MKARAIYVSIITLFFAIVYVSCFDSKLDTNGDSAAYIALGHNIANGLGYSDVGVDGVSAASFFPVGYPFILSLWIMVGLQSLVAIKILSGLFMLVAIVLMFLFVDSATKNRPLALIVALLSCLSPQLITFATMPMSEMSYMFFSFLALYGLSRLSQKGDGWKSPWFWIVVLSAVAGYYIRTIGASMFVAIAAYFIMTRRWRELTISLGSIALLTSLWSIRNASLGLSSRYFGTIMTVNPWRPEEGEIGSVGELIVKMIHNFDETVIKGFKELLFPYLSVNYESGSTFAGVIIGLAVLGVVLYGLWQLKPLRFALIAYFIANIGLFMLWHGGNGSRYVTPLTPLIFAGFYFGIYHIISKLAGQEFKVVSYAMLLAALPMFSPIKSTAQYAKMPYEPNYRNYIDMAKEVNVKVPKGSVICSRKPAIFHHFAPNTINVNYRYTLDQSELVRDLIDKRVSFVVLEQLGYSSTPRYLYPAIEGNAELFTPVWQLDEPQTYLFFFDRDKAISKYGQNR